MTNADARGVLEALVGRQIRTLTGRPNTVMALVGSDVLVGTNRSPAGQRVPIADLQSALDRLRETGEVEISVSSLGHRSSFIGAVLSELPETVLARTTPPRVHLADPLTRYRASEAGDVNAWWSDDRRQRFWLEITDRPDIGVDLHCPQRDSAGNRSPGFSLIWWVRAGDIVFHYSLKEHAIVGWSRAAVGQVTEAPTLWLSHRGETRRKLRSARAQPGWWLDLDGSFPLDAPVALAKLRDHADQIRAVLDQLKTRNSGSLYFPFFFWGGTELRPMQPYLNKLPAELIGIIPELAAAVATAEPSTAEPSPSRHNSVLGTAYRVARVNTMGNGRQPFSVDPALVERGLRGHADTQNALAAVLTAAEIEPKSRHPHEPNYDLAWQIGTTVYVAEVKSTTDENEEEQLRLGLGQVLRYRHTLLRLGHVDVVAVLVPERDPKDGAWRELCRELGVVLMSGAELEQAPALPQRSTLADTPAR